MPFRSHGDATTQFRRCVTDPATATATRVPASRGGTRDDRRPRERAPVQARPSSRVRDRLTYDSVLKGARVRDRNRGPRPLPRSRIALLSARRDASATTADRPAGARSRGVRRPRDHAGEVNAVPDRARVIRPACESSRWYARMHGNEAARGTRTPSAP